MMSCYKWQCRHMDISVAMDWLKDKKTRTERLLFYACVGAFFSMPLGIAPMTFFGILAASVWLFSGIAFRRRHIYIQHSWSWPIILLMILPWVGLLYSPDATGLGLKYAKKTHYWIYGMALAAVAFNRFQSKQLVQAFLDARGNRSLWYARLLNSLGIKNLDQHLLTALRHQTGSVRADLLELLSPKAGKDAADMLAGLAASENNPDIIAAVVKTVNRLDSDSSAVFDYAPFLNSNHPEIKAHALIGLYRRTPEKYSSTIASWLHSEDLDQRKAALLLPVDQRTSLLPTVLKKCWPPKKMSRFCLLF